MASLQEFFSKYKENFLKILENILLRKIFLYNFNHYLQRNKRNDNPEGRTIYVQWLPLMAALNDFTWFCQYIFRHMLLTFYHVHIFMIEI